LAVAVAPLKGLTVDQAKLGPDEVQRAIRKALKKAARETLEKPSKANGSKKGVGRRLNGAAHLNAPTALQRHGGSFVHSSLCHSYRALLRFGLVAAITERGATSFSYRPKRCSTRSRSLAKGAGR
jgi:hypothetical protein